MHVRRLTSLIAATLSLAALIHVRAASQEPPPQQPPAGGGRGAGQGRGGPQGRGGNTFPAQQRQLGDAALIARGKGIYDTMCGACHGVDLRGGQLGGPNLLRSQTVLLDKRGELIGPVILAGRPNPTPPAPVMPAFPMPPDDLTAVSEYIHSVLAQGGRQGRPPVDDTVTPERILVGDAAAGQAYFQRTCSNCHSVTGDLKGIAARVADARELQNLWVSGGGGGRGGGRGRGGISSRATVKIALASGGVIEGRVSRIDDFLVSVILEDGTRRTFVRHTAADPKIDITDPGDAHRKLVMALADKDMHNVTAYLWTVKP